MGFTAENTLTALLRECQFDETVTFGRSTGSISDAENRANTIEREREREEKIDPAFTSDHLSDKSKFQCGRKSFGVLKVIFLLKGLFLKDCRHY